MGLLIKFLLITSLLVGEESHVNAQEISWKKYYIKQPIGDFEASGSIWMIKSSNNTLINNINKTILEKCKSILLWEKYKFKEDYLKRVLTSDEFENIEPYNNYIEGDIYFTFRNILSYRFRFNILGDKGSPYYEYLNIDTKSIKPIREDVILKNKLIEFHNACNSYANLNKQNVVNEYQKKLSEKADPHVELEFSVFASKRYSYSKVNVKLRDSLEIISFNKAGAQLVVGVIDENFNEDASYEAIITIPYKILVKYLDKNSGIYMAVIQLSNSSNSKTEKK